jgi:hypothetical protein
VFHQKWPECYKRVIHVQNRVEFHLASSTKLLVSLGVGDDVLGVNVDILSSSTREPVLIAQRNYSSIQLYVFSELVGCKDDDLPLGFINQALYTLIACILSGDGRNDQPIIEQFPAQTIRLQQ